MNQSEMVALAKELAPTIRRFVDDAIRPLSDRLAAMEARPVLVPKDGTGIVDAIKDDAGFLVLTLSDGRTLKPGIRDGKDAEPVVPDDLRPLVSDEVAKQVEALPKPKNGEDANPEQIVEAVKAEVAKAKAEIEAETVAGIDAAFAALPKGPEGPTADEVKAMVVEHIAAALPEAIAALPPPQAGKDADMEQVAALVAEKVQVAVAEAVATIPRAKDGIGMAGGFLDRDGNLVLTSTDGKTHPVGRVVGNDGDPGKPGFGFEHIGVDYDGERTITIKFTRGDEVKEFPFVLPMVLDRGVYKEGKEYEPGDGVTWGGCYYVAKKVTTSKPDAGNDDWRLTVRKGRDGKTPKPPEKG